MNVESKVTTGTLPTAADGAQVQASIGKYGQNLTADLLPKYYEAVQRGMVYTGGTAVTGVAPGTAIGTTSPFTFSNPKGSGVLGIPLRVTCSYISGTLGAGSAHYVGNLDPTAAAPTGTAIVIAKTRLASAAAASVGNRCLLFTTATIPAPTVLRPAWSWTALLASTAVAPYLIKDDLDGEFVVEPGCALSVESTAAAGSTPLVTFGLTWVELPI